MSFLTVVSTVGAAGGAAQTSTWQPIIMLVIFGLIFYFMLIRPQQKRAKEHKSLVEGLQKGDEVVTIGGVLGRVIKVKDHYVVIALTDNVEITVQKHAVSAVLPKGTLDEIHGK